eukprot:5894131-Pleurochrysis_carterae.AAC.3
MELPCTVYTVGQEAYIRVHNESGVRDIIPGFVKSSPASLSITGSPGVVQFNPKLSVLPVSIWKAFKRNVVPRKLVFLS